LSSLKVNQTKSKLLAMFEAHLDLNDVAPYDPEREFKVLTRCLAAFAIYMQTGCSLKDAAAAVWDGADDNGIDAAMFDPADSCVTFVQSKWIQKGAGEPEAKDLGAFAKGVKDAIEQDITNFHPRLSTKFNDIATRLATPGTSVHVVVISTGVSTIAKHGQAVISGLLQELNGDDPTGIVTSEIMGLAEVYSGLANNPLEGNIALDANILEWTYVPTPYPAYFGMVDGLQLKEWWKKHGKMLLASNIRHSLGDTEVNNQIKNTAITTPDRFWYFNNGITLVADEALKAPAGAASRSSGIFTFKGASIVNGAQTVSSLGKVDNDGSLGNVRVPIRVVLLKTAPADFGGEVTRTNNLQNRIEPRDFVARDPEQRRLRQEMAIEGIDYQFVRSEEVVLPKTACELIEVTTALACAAGDPALAVHVKTGISRFFADLNKAPYKAIFNPTLSGARAFNTTVVQREIDAWIDQKKKSLPKKTGTAWGVFVHGNRILSAIVFKKFNFASLSQPISSFATSLNVATLHTLCDAAHASMVNSIQTHYSGRVLAVLFKNPTMSKNVFDRG